MNICITRTEKGRYSETFIDNQIAKISQWAQVFAVHGGRLPQRDGNNKLLSPFLFWVLHNIIKFLTGRRNNYFGNYGFKKFLKKNKIDVVLANYGIAGVHILPVCKSAGVPLVVHFHGFDATQKNVLDKYAETYKIMFREVAAIVVVSVDMKIQLISLDAPEQKISLIPCGIDLKKFTPQFVKKQTNLFISVGRFIEKKSPQSTVRAFALVRSKEVARLIMTGQKTGLYEDCKKIAEELNIENDVEFTGIQSPEKVALHMQEANVFVQHSVTAENGDKEGTPNTILEAAASGLPIVSTKHAGIKEAVIDGTNGFLVEEHDIDTMAAQMQRLIDNPQLAIQMGMKGRMHMEENYDLDKQAAKLYNVLKKAANEKSL